MILRPLRDTEEDAEAVGVVAAAAFGAPHALGGAPGTPEPPERIARYRSINRHLARTDPGGCWLALDDAGTPVGTAFPPVARAPGDWR